MAHMNKNQANTKIFWVLCSISKHTRVLGTPGNLYRAIDTPAIQVDLIGFIQVSLLFSELPLHRTRDIRFMMKYVR